MNQFRLLALAAVLAAPVISADEIPADVLEARAATSRSAVKIFAQNLQRFLSSLSALFV